MIPFKINFIWIATMLLILMTSTSSFPLFENFPLINDSAETTTPTVIHHRHRKVRSFATPLSPQTSPTQPSLQGRGKSQAKQTFATHKTLLAMALNTTIAT
ncbi:hypothetical protein ANCCAN_00610 [Ancylostoma caninum]|uniref:7TM GPCR serpentine receptor class x (Srx) domain-containing protein n=1 Tax=Ancylostoma caninum TaxID=29170 RepID=A0A368H8Y3_ANCCA|nr:hypothetical protein ANCCAN_00610 [Ancylostoma caninum]